MGRKERLIWGYGIGLCGFAAGLILSSVFDLPSGALIVLALTFIAVIVFSANQKPKEIGKVQKI